MECIKYHRPCLQLGYYLHFISHRRTIGKNACSRITFSDFLSYLLNSCIMLNRASQVNAIASFDLSIHELKSAVTFYNLVCICTFWFLNIDENSRLATYEFNHYRTILGSTTLGCSKKSSCNEL